MWAEVKRALKALPAVVRQPPYVPPGHFYSPLTTRADAEHALARTAALPGIDLDADAQLALARTFTWEVPSGRYHDAVMFGAPDAAIYADILRIERPRRVVEVGSGFSSAVALDTHDAEYVFIEPYPDRLRSILRPDDHVSIREEPVQRTPTSVLTECDLLFVDSTHVVKAGSDVQRLVLEVLPALRPGTLVHFHDCFWPFEYPEAWLRERRDWNELYLLHAFLVHNSEWQIVLFADWLFQRHPEVVPERWRGLRPGSLWLRRRALRAGADPGAAPRS